MASPLGLRYDGSRLQAARGAQPSWLYAVLGVVLLVSTFTERSTIPVGTVDLYPGQLLAFLLFPLALSAAPSVRGLGISVGGFALVSVVLMGASVLLLPDPLVRVKLAGQLIINCVVLLSAFALFSATPPATLRVVVRLVAGIFLVGSVVQIVLFPGELIEGERFAGLPRPNLTFAEAAWLATACALFFAFTLAQRMWVSSAVFGILTLGIFTRGALVIAMAAVLGLPRLSSSRLYRAAIYAALTALGLWFLWQSLFGPAPSTFGFAPANDSLESRTFDTFVIRVGNSNDFYPLGGEVMSYRIFNFWRVNPDSSNVQGFDLIWKFGLGGLLILILWWYATSIAWPRIALGAGRILPLGTDAAPIRFALYALPATMQFNNAFGRPWSWAIVGLLLAALAVYSHRPATTPPRDTAPVP